jgi:hypothetical protein
MRYARQPLSCTGAPEGGVEIGVGGAKTAQVYSTQGMALPDPETAIRVAALEQTRHNIFQPDPWGEPKFMLKHPAR